MQPEVRIRKPSNKCGLYSSLVSTGKPGVLRDQQGELTDCVVAFEKPGNNPLVYGWEVPDASIKWD